jgi:hypothetical protein
MDGMGIGRKPKTGKCLMSPVQRSQYINLKVTEVNMGRGLGTSEKVSRDESTWAVTHLCMEPMLGISMSSYPYLN